MKPHLLPTDYSQQNAHTLKGWLSAHKTVYLDQYDLTKVVVSHKLQDCVPRYTQKIVTPDTRIKVLGIEGAYEFQEYQTLEALRSICNDIKPVPLTEPFSPTPHRGVRDGFFFRIPKGHAPCIIDRGFARFGNYYLTDKGFFNKVKYLGCDNTLVAFGYTSLDHLDKTFVVLDVLFRKGVDYTGGILLERREANKSLTDVKKSQVFKVQRGGVVLPAGKVNSTSYRYREVPKKGRDVANVYLNGESMIVKLITKTKGGFYDLLTGNLLKSTQVKDSMFEDKLLHGRVFYAKDGKVLKIEGIEVAKQTVVEMSDVFRPLTHINDVRKDSFSVKRDWNEPHKNGLKKMKDRRFGIYYEPKTEIQWAEGVEQIYRGIQASLS